MTPADARATLVFIDIVHQVFNAQAEQRETAWFEHSVKVGQSGLVLFAWNVNYGVIGADPVERIVREIQPGP